MKSYGHIYMANILRQELIDNGGNIILKIQKGVKEKYKIPENFYKAIRDYPSYFRAGSVGPDFFPDLIFGQMIIHPINSGEWLKLMLDELATIPPSDPEYYPSISFYLGFMLHYAGDMFTHDYVNSYAKGWFQSFKHIINNLSSKNETRISQGKEEIKIIIRHLAIETYLDNFLKERVKEGKNKNDFFKNFSTELDIPYTYIRSCFASKKSMELKKKILNNEEIDMDILGTYVKYYENALTDNDSVYNIMEKETYIKDWLEFWEKFSQNAINKSLKKALDDESKALAHFFSNHKIKTETGRTLVDYFFKLIEFFEVIHIDFLFEPLFDLIKEGAKKLVEPYIKEIASEISGKNKNSIKDFNHAVEIILNSFKDVKHLLRRKELFDNSNLPEILEKEWGRLGKNSDCYRQDFLALEQSLSMAKLCIMGTEKLNDIISEYTNGRLKDKFKPVDVNYGIRELRIRMKTSNKKNADTNANIIFGIKKKNNSKNLTERTLGKFYRKSEQLEFHTVLLNETIPISSIESFYFELKSDNLWIASEIDIYDNRTGIKLASARDLKVPYKEKVYIYIFKNLDTEYVIQETPNNVPTVSNKKNINNLLVTIKTSDKSFAGTDNDVYLNINTKYSSISYILDKDYYNDFEREDLDTYNITLKGPLKTDEIKNFTLWKKGDDDWHVDHITIRDEKSDKLIVPQYKIEKKVDRNGIVIPLKDTSIPPVEINIEKLKLENLRVIIKTSNEIFSGTDGDVFLEVIYKNSFPEKIFLDTPWHNDFEKGDTDSFDIKLRNKIAAKEIKGFKILKDGGDSWKIDKVIIHDIDTGLLLVKEDTPRKIKTDNDEIYMNFDLYVSSSN